MHAYSQVDGNVRRKLEEMLKTWREPVPGSLSTTPVFPINSTQNIVDNLNKLRASATAQPRFQPHPQVRLPSAQPYVQSPTPPVPYMAPTPVPKSQGVSFSSKDLGRQLIHIQYAPTPPIQYNQPYQSMHQPSQHVQYQQPQPQQQPQYQQSYPPPYRSPLPQAHVQPAHNVDMTKLHEDIDDLTTDAKIECATHPMDQAAQGKLQTLQTLKEILDSGTASPNDIIDIRNSISKQVAKKMAERAQPLAPSHMPPMPVRPSFLPSPQPTQAPSLPPHPQPHQPSANPAIFNSTNLAELLRATASQTSTPQPPPYAYGPPAPSTSTPHLGTTNGAAGPVGENPLLAQLRASGFLSANSTPPQVQTPPTVQYANLAPIEVTFMSASIKIPRPQMVTSFLTARPNQCSTCGRRFTSDELGREKKARHLDWHFKTKARMIEAERRGQNRSWYVDEREWIASREHDEDAPEEAANGASPSAATKMKQADFVRAPSDPVLRSLPCPIDQEPFKSEWSEEVQDFIWKDTVHIGGRYYHASCYKEVTKDRGKDAGGLTPLGAGMRTATPDSVLGKRKAEQDVNGAKSKLKVEA